MRAWRVHELGDPAAVLSPDEVEQPTPGPGQLLVRVRVRPSLVAEMHADLTRLFEAGQIAPLVGQVLPLDQAPQALTSLADRASIGKIVLVP